MELELELEHVLLDLHVKLLNQSHAAHGFVQQVLISIVLVVAKALRVAI
jgi:hypothetical protein